MNITIQTFGYPGTLVKEYEHWVMLLRPKQITVGSLVLAAKSDANHLGQLTQEEWAEFALVCHDAEGFTAKAFGAEKFNYLSLMMKDPNVHFHFVPRYSKPITINANQYLDSDWPLKTELNAIEMPPEDFEFIKTKLVNPTT